MRRLLIIGAGSAGKTVAREIINNTNLNYNLLGFLDNDKFKLEKEIFGYKVLGSHNNLKEKIKLYDVKEIIIAITCIDKKDIEKIYNEANATGIKVKILPNFEELLLDKPFKNQIRDVSVEDLLGRESIQINSKSIKDYIQEKRILVTGAAGSIGSELCRQIIKYKPKHLLMLDVNENDLYLLELFLKRHHDAMIDTEICNIREKTRLDYLMKNYKPQIIFHAAAHKHVPLMEKSPEEAVKNNVFGTKNVIDLSDKYEVEKFVMISTDKAVNPTNIMGATKRLAELLVENKNKMSKTKFMATRFGNVLGSNGSVIPIFKSLIEEGRNLTVTHPEITRYFMTIPEAAELVVEAGSIGKGGEVFVLDMGEPVKIMELAKKMINLSGLILGEDIDIEITGLRPGEKLYEELLYEINDCKKTQNKKIFINRLREESKNLEGELKKLENYVEKFEKQKIKEKLKQLVPTYKEVKYN